MKKISYVICGGIFIIVIILLTNVATENTLLKEIYENNFSKTSENGNLSLIREWTVYNNLDENNVKIAITFQNEEGINEIETPEGLKIQGNGKDKVAIDYQITPNVEEKFKIKLMNNKNIEESFIASLDDIQEKITEKVINDCQVGDLAYYDNKLFKVLNTQDNIEMISQKAMGSISFEGKSGWDRYISTLNTACAKLFNDSRILKVRSARIEDYASATDVWLANTYVEREIVGSYHLDRWRVNIVPGNVLGHDYETLAHATTYGTISDNGPWTHGICPVITVNKKSINAVGNNTWYIK